MPAKRLPWLKLWPEAIDHEKVAQLGDAEFRTWITVLARAAQQPIRWRFASLKHAAVATGRPLGHIRTLVTFRLLDDKREDGLWVHDWRQWQERYASDYEDSPDHPPNGNGTLPEDSVNAPPTPSEDSVNAAASPRAKKGEGRRETLDVEERTETKDVPLSSRARRARRETEVDDEFRELMVTEFAETLGGRAIVLDTIDDALGHTATRRRTDLKAYVKHWLRKDAVQAEERKARVPISQAQAPLEDDDLAERVECPECHELIAPWGYGHKREVVGEDIQVCSRYWQRPDSWQGQEAAA